MTKLAVATLACLCLSAMPAAAAGLLADIPAPPDGKILGSKTISSGGEAASYSTPANPAAVISSYQEKLGAAGWTVAGGGASGSSYGGGGGLRATNGAKYLVLEAGGPAGTTFVHVCEWPAQPKDDHCGD